MFYRTIALVLLLAPLLFAQTPAKPVPAAAAHPTAVIETTAGKLTCELFPDKAPKTVANFVGLARGTKDWKDPLSSKPRHGVPLYTGTIFHRVIPNFMIQGGDPAGNGTGGPGYTFADEFVPGLTFDRPGRLAMANSGPGTNGSQFFITEVPTPWLDMHHTIFGQCDAASVELVKQIARMPRDERPSSNKPAGAVKITRITISGAAATRPGAKPAARRKPASASTKPRQ